MFKKFYCLKTLLDYFEKKVEKPIILIKKKRYIFNKKNTLKIRFVYCDCSQKQCNYFFKITDEATVIFVD